MPRLLLVRHGQSTWNADGRWQGQADPPLSDFGRMQALHAARAIGAVDAIYASTLERAAHTATIIAEQIGIGPVNLLRGLSERDAGEWSGLTRAQIERSHPGDLDAGRRPSGWESDESLTTRVRAALSEIVAVHVDGDVVVITHGGVIYRLEDDLGGRSGRIANLGGRWIEIDRAGRWTLGDRVDLLDGAEITIPDQI